MFLPDFLSNPTSNAGYHEICPDTISYNAYIDAWARSGEKIAAERAEQILRHMDKLHASGNTRVKADSYSYNTVLNAFGPKVVRSVHHDVRAEHVLLIMETKFRNGDTHLKPNTRSYTTVIDTWAKSLLESNAARKAEQIFIGILAQYEQTMELEAKPNTATANAVMNSCAFTQFECEKPEALSIAFRVFYWLCSQDDIHPDSYTYTIMLAVCSNLLPKGESHARYSNAQRLFFSCKESGHVNDFVPRKLRNTGTDEEYRNIVGHHIDYPAKDLPSFWTRNATKVKKRYSKSS